MPVAVDSFAAPGKGEDMPTELAAVLVDARDPATLGEWWAHLLGWGHTVDDEGDAIVAPPAGAGPFR